MKSKHWLLLLALAVPSLYCHAEVAINKTSNIAEHNQPMRCDDAYQHALQYQPIKLDTAITVDKEMAQLIMMSRQFAHDYFMSANIADFPTNDDIKSLGGHINEAYIKVNDRYLTQEDIVQTLVQLYVYYFVGEYVPKDDYQAIAYLEKLVDYYEQDKPSQAGMLINLALLSFNYDEISQQNPMSHMDDQELVQIVESLLLQAGSINLKASLITDGLYQAQASCHDDLITKLETLANEGSVFAIHSLIEFYEESGNYEKELEYWQQRAQDYSVKPINLSWN